jgi:C1A family cysteine protease
MARFVPRALGWIRDLPDPRDYSAEHPAVRELLAPLRHSRPARGGRPAAVAWDEYLPPPRDQLAAPSCAAHACATLVDYFARRAYGREVDGSCQFLDRMVRRMHRALGDAGATLRATFKALRRFGLPPRRHWPVADGGAETEPDGFLFCFAREYEPLVYLRLDAPGGDGGRTLSAVKGFLAGGLAVAFGFAIFDSLTADGEVAFPSSFDAPIGGQAVVVVGYDDGRRVRSEKGALRVRSSWGAGWGEDGCGWLPYRYVEEQLSADFWTVLRPDWLASGEFTFPA